MVFSARTAAAILALISALSPLHAQSDLDVVFLNDGTILIGTLAGVSVNGIEFEVLGKKIVLDPDDFYRNEKGLSCLAGLEVDIVLADGTTIRGTIEDFDPDIGLFVNISIGMLTLPAASVDRIVDPARKLLWEGPDFQVGALGTAYWPIASDSFDLSATVGLTLDVKLPWVRGLFAGIDLEYRFMAFSGDEPLSYAVYQLCPVIGYRFMGLRTQPGFLSMFVPFFRLGFGFSFISVEDLREGVYPSSYGGLVGHVAAQVGTDVKLGAGFGFALSARYLLLFQAGSPFQAFDLVLAATYEF